MFKCCNHFGTMCHAPPGRSPCKLTFVTQRIIHLLSLASVLRVCCVVLNIVFTKLYSCYRTGLRLQSGEACCSQYCCLQTKYINRILQHIHVRQATRDMWLLSCSNQPICEGIPPHQCYSRVVKTIDVLVCLHKWVGCCKMKSTRI